MDKIKFFDEVCKLLLALAACAWIIHVMLVLFVGNEGCMAVDSTMLFRISSFAAGIMTAPPIVYSLVRLLFWPGGPKNTSVHVMGWVLSGGVGLFIATAIIFALTISQFGCQ
jgi:hypothetical protein